MRDLLRFGSIGPSLLLLASRVGLKLNAPFFYRVNRVNEMEEQVPNRRTGPEDGRSNKSRNEEIGPKAHF
uniref:Putative ovule protein n=1 Tax=Solanum chacoense TaxID=4108 RepID=A0A0V0IH54_SOLCH